MPPRKPPPIPPNSIEPRSPPSANPAIPPMRPPKKLGRCSDGDGWVSAGEGLEGVVGLAGDEGRAGVEYERRSEEHTSELQSQSNLVCRLLLEKKKHNIIRTYSSAY